MKKILCLLLLFTAVARAEVNVESIYTQSSYWGLADQYRADDIDPRNSPDLANIYLDEYQNSITRRKGSVKDNATAFGGNLWVREIYPYKKIDGTEYKVVCTSTSVLISNGDTTYSSLLAGQDATATFDFTTAKDNVYGANGYNIFKSTGETASLITIVGSTNIPTTAKYIKYINNRMLYTGFSTFTFNNGIEVGKSTLIYSELNDPDNVQDNNYININVSDGDFITGIFASNGQTFVTKRYSTWQLLETSVGVFQIVPVSLNIGCLYQTTMANWQNYPIWVSDRGVELFDGQFNLISRIIDNTMGGLSQLDVGASTLVQDTALDWGEGSGVNIDTTTYSGSVAMPEANFGTWTQRSISTEWTDIDINFDGSIQIASNRPSSGRVYVSTNSGVTWDARAATARWRGVAISDDGTIQAAVSESDQNVYLSTDTGTTWNSIKSGLTSVFDVDMSANGSVISVADYGGNIHVSTDSGSSFSSKASAKNWQRIKVSNDGRVQVAIIDAVDYIYVSTDTGSTWQTRNTGTFDYDGISISANGDVIMASARGGGTFVYLSTDYGITWNDKAPDAGLTTIWDVAVSSKGDISVLLVEDDNIIYRSFDTGDNWSSQSAPTTLTNCKVAMSAVGIYQSIIRSNDYIYTNNSVTYSDESSFTSQALEATNWGSWGTFSADETKPSGSTITYYIKTSTANDNFDSKTATLITNGSSISSSVGEYVQIISTFTRSVSDSIPKLNKFTITYFGTSNMTPDAVVYKDRYYLIVDADNDLINDTALTYDHNGQWTKQTGNWGSACVYRDILTVGDSTKGQVYNHDVDNVYSDDGVAYDSYYATKMYDMREQDPANTIREKGWSEVWLRMNQETSGTLDLDYRLDGSTGDWVTLFTYPLSQSSGVSVAKFNFPGSLTANFMQLRFRNNTATDSWNIKGHYLPFIPYQRQ